VKTGTYGWALPVRRRLLAADSTPPAPRQPKPVSEAVQKARTNAGYVKWLLERERMTYKQAAEALQLPYNFVYTVASGMAHRHIDASCPPPEVWKA
jgi:hypothetical protein